MRGPQDSNYLYVTNEVDPRDGYFHISNITVTDTYCRKYHDRGRIGTGRVLSYRYYNPDDENRTAFLLGLFKQNPCQECLVELTKELVSNYRFRE